MADGLSSRSRPQQDDLAVEWIADLDRAPEHYCRLLWRRDSATTGCWMAYEPGSGHAGRWRPADDLAMTMAATFLRGAGAVGRSLRGVRGVVGLATARLSADVLRGDRPDPDFDRDPRLIPLADGRVAEVSPRGVRERDATPEDYLTASLGVGSPRWLEGAPDCPAWLGFLAEALESLEDSEEVVAFLQEWVGVALTGETALEVALWLYGPPGTGKSTVARVLLGLFGGLGSAVAWSRLDDRGGAGHRHWLAALEGRRLTLVDEVPAGARIQTEDLRNLISGQRIECNRMRQDSREFTPQTHLLFASNHRPRIDSEDGMFRRLRILPFTHQPARPDSGLLGRLMLELPGILAWALDGLDAVAGRRGFRPDPASVVAAAADFRRGSDPLGSWAQDAIERDPGGWLTLDDAHAAFAEWHREEFGEARKVMTKAWLSRRVKGTFGRGTVTHGSGRNRVRVFEGLRLRADGRTD